MEHARPGLSSPKASGKDALAILFTFLTEHADEFNFYLISLCKQQSLEIFPASHAMITLLTPALLVPSCGLSAPPGDIFHFKEVLVLCCKIFCELELVGSGGGLVASVLLGAEVPLESLLSPWSSTRSGDISGGLSMSPLTTGG